MYMYILKSRGILVCAVLYLTSVLPRILGRPGGLLTQIFESACTVKKIILLWQAFFFIPRILGWLSEFSIVSCDTA